MKLKTLPQAVQTARKMDAETALNESMLSELITSGCLPYEKHGNRTVIDFDSTLVALNQMFGQEPSGTMPRIRSIRTAARYLKKSKPELGLSESRIRYAVENSQVDCIRIGNRAYISLEMFDEPYVRRFTQIQFKKEEKKTFGRNALEQIGQIIAGSQGQPTVRRVRKTT